MVVSSWNFFPSGSFPSIFARSGSSRRHSFRRLILESEELDSFPDIFLGGFLFDTIFFVMDDLSIVIPDELKQGRIYSIQCELEPAMGVELGIDAFDMRSDCILAYEESSSNFVIAFALTDKS